MASDGETDRAIAEILRVHVSILKRTRARYVEGGIEVRCTRPPSSTKTTEIRWSTRSIIEKRQLVLKHHQEEIALSMQLLAERIVSLNIVDSVSKETVRSYLKKTLINLG
ncbi:transposase [Tolypothrix sp. NIES-4075]|nr:transposase [Tolypothrix sp. NIES-4075]